MVATGPLQLIFFAVVAGVSALCGFAASTVSLRKRKRARVYFVLGVATGLLVAAVPRVRLRGLSAAAALARGLFTTTRSGAR
jgi:hypothetical protein